MPEACNSCAAFVLCGPAPILPSQVLDYFKLPHTAVLVVVDETALDLGQLRLRKTGTAGGHNGLKSVEAHLKTRDYARLRMGVGAGRPTWVMKLFSSCMEDKGRGGWWFY